MSSAGLDVATTETLVRAVESPDPPCTPSGGLPKSACIVLDTVNTGSSFSYIAQSYTTSQEITMRSNAHPYLCSRLRLGLCRVTRSRSWKPWANDARICEAQTLDQTLYSHTLKVSITLSLDGLVD